MSNPTQVPFIYMAQTTNATLLTTDAEEANRWQAEGRNVETYAHVPKVNIDFGDHAFTSG